MRINWYKCIPSRFVLHNKHPYRNILYLPHVKSSTNKIYFTDVEDMLPVNEFTDDIYDLEADLPSDSAGASAPPAPEGDACSAAPATDSAPAEPVSGTSAEVDKPQENEIPLDEDILLFLGEVPTKDKKFGAKIQNDIASRWEHVATTGVSKEAGKDILQKYLTPENCSLIDPPTLNLEVKAALSEPLQKKDTAIHNKQKQIAAAVSCIGQALTRTLSQDQKDPELIKLLIDAGRIICNVQHTESMIRRGFIGSFIKKDVKDHLNNTCIDKYLFGEKLADTLKTAKSITRSATEIRARTNTLRPQTKSVVRHLNPKGPAAANRPPPAGRRLEQPAPARAPAPPPPPPRRRPPPPPLPPQAPRSQQRPRAPRR